MYASNRRAGPCLVLPWLQFICSSFNTAMIVALIFLHSLSDSHVIPSSQALQKHSLPSNTTLSENALKVYIIYSFVQGPSSDTENEKIRLHLGMLLAPTDVQEYGGEYTGVEFWRVKMSNVQRTAFASAIPRVSILFRNLTSQLLIDARLKYMKTHSFYIMKVLSLR